VTVHADFFNTNGIFEERLYVLILAKDAFQHKTPEGRPLADPGQDQAGQKQQEEKIKKDFIFFH